MLGVNVAKSSLHLHFLKTLEFRTDLSVTGMPGAARAIKACRFLPPHTPVGVQDLRHKAAACPNLSAHPVPFHDWSMPVRPLGIEHHKVCVPRPCQGAGFFCPLMNLGANALPVESGCLALPQPGPPRAQIQVWSPHVKVVTFLFCSTVALYPPHPPSLIDFTKVSCSDGPGSGEEEQGR